MVDDGPRGRQRSTVEGLSQIPGREVHETSQPSVNGPTITDRRSRILEVATRRIAEYGFEATTVRAIADDVKILSGSLYHHFATKDDILHEIVRDSVKAMRDNMNRVARAKADPEHRLVALILLDLGELIRNQQVHSILYNERRFFRRNKDFAYVVKAKKEGYLAWKHVLDDGIRQGLFNANLDIYLTITTIVRMLNVAAEWFRSEDIFAQVALTNYTLANVEDFHVNFILNAIRDPERAALAIPRKESEELARFHS